MSGCQCRATAEFWLGALLAAFAMVAVACGGDGRAGENDRLVLTPVSGRYIPQVLNSDLAVGTNRFLLGLLDDEKQAPVVGAALHVRLFPAGRDADSPALEADTTPIVVTKTFTHTHEDGIVETHDAGETGAYVSEVDFPSAGKWIVEVSGFVDGERLEGLTFLFEVRPESVTPAIGEPAPRSVQPILPDVGGDISRIDTSERPIEDMHRITIAEAVTSGQPTVIVFATPAFCTSQICGPTKAIVDDLYARHKGNTNFIHVEPYDIEKARRGEGLEPLPFITEEWGLMTEPWVFVIDAEGNVAAKFEALVSFEELEGALAPLLAAGRQPAIFLDALGGPPYNPVL